MLLRRIGSADSGGDKHTTGQTGQNPPKDPVGGLTAIKERAAAEDTRPSSPRDRNDIPMTKQEKILYELKVKVQERLVADME
jgi:hypothetical protein